VVSVTALRDANGVIIGYLLIGTDNTARKLVEEEQKKLDQRLRDQQFYTRSLIESNIDALMTTDPSGIITDVNKQMEALTGCTRDELIGAPFKDYFTDPERAEAGIKRVLSEKKSDRLRADRQGPRWQTDGGFLQRHDLLRPRAAPSGRIRGRPRRDRAQARRGRAAAGQGRRRKRQPHQVRLPGQHEPRNPHAHEFAIMGIADLLAKTACRPSRTSTCRSFGGRATICST
jgi:PAS domain S-box-containing protein